MSADETMPTQPAALVDAWERAVTARATTRELGEQRAALATATTRAAALWARLADERRDVQRLEHVGPAWLRAVASGDRAARVAAEQADVDQAQAALAENVSRIEDAQMAIGRLEVQLADFAGSENRLAAELDAWEAWLRQRSLPPSSELIGLRARADELRRILAAVAGLRADIASASVVLARAMDTVRTAIAFENARSWKRGDLTPTLFPTVSQLMPLDPEGAVDYESIAMTVSVACARVDAGLVTLPDLAVTRLAPIAGTGLRDSLLLAEVERRTAWLRPVEAAAAERAAAAQAELTHLRYVREQWLTAPPTSAPIASTTTSTAYPLLPDSR